MLCAEWTKVGSVEDFPTDLGSCVKVDGQQIAVFHLGNDEWYAVQNMNPVNQRMVLSRGIVGCTESGPKVACPLHKQNFSLVDGERLDGEGESLHVFPIKVENGDVLVQA